MILCKFSRHRRAANVVHGLMSGRCVQMFANFQKNTLREKCSRNAHLQQRACKCNRMSMPMRVPRPAYLSEDAGKVCHTRTIIACLQIHARRRPAFWELVGGRKTPAISTARLSDRQRDHQLQHIGCTPKHKPGARPGG